MRLFASIIAALLIAFHGYTQEIEYLPGGGPWELESENFAEILGGNHWNTTSVASNCSDEDATGVNIPASAQVGTVECNRSASPAPAEGAEYAYLTGLDLGNDWFEWSAAWAALTAGARVYEWDMLMNVEDSPPDGSTNFWYASDGGVASFPALFVDPTNDNYTLRCSAGVNDTTTATYTVGTWLEMKVIWYHTGGPIGAGDEECATDGSACAILYMDGTPAAKCDGALGADEPDGMAFFTSVDVADMGFDRTYACSSLPPAGTRCGDGAPNLVP